MNLYIIAGKCLKVTVEPPKKHSREEGSKEIYLYSIMLFYEKSHLQ